METKTYIIKEFDNIIKIGTTFGKNWYRGHSMVYGELTPKIFRVSCTHDIHRAFKPDFELQTVESFKRYAPSILRTLPENNDNLSWLFIMQHHGFPTRLLDWSESILVALFFSVIANPTEDGEIWTILPWALNEKHGNWGLPILDKSKVLKYLANEPFYKISGKLIEELELKEKPNKPMALLPHIVLPRISNQLSAFTIHPEPNKGNTIPDLVKDEKHLVRYIIPSNLKSDFEKKLSYLGITHRTLFPDMEGLLNSFKRDERYYGWGQPPHPDI